MWDTTPTLTGTPTQAHTPPMTLSVSALLPYRGGWLDVPRVLSFLDAHYAALGDDAVRCRIRVFLKTTIIGGEGTLDWLLASLAQRDDLGPGLPAAMARSRVNLHRHALTTRDLVDLARARASAGSKDASTAAA